MMCFVQICRKITKKEIHICLSPQAFPRLNGEHGVNEKCERGMPGTREEREHQYKGRGRKNIQKIK